MPPGVANQVFETYIASDDYYHWGSLLGFMPFLEDGTF